MFQDIKPPKRSGPKPVDHSSLSKIGQKALTNFNQAANAASEPVSRAKKVHFRRLRGWWLGLGQNSRFAIVSFALLLFISWAIGYFYITRPVSETSIAITKIQRKPPPPKTLPSPLTGVEVDPALAQRPVTGIMVENSLDARPQSGIQDAGVVVEAIAEGGITRFLTLYQESRPQYIGPVRSLRPYYIDFVVPFDASIAHVGGSPTALKQIRSPGMKDLDQFFNAGSYWRVNSRAAPHNVYTSFTKLDALNKSKGYKKSKFTPLPRKEDAKLSTPTATSIDITMSGYYFNDHYVYDSASNSYLRYEGGQKHLVTSSEFDRHPKQLHPKVVVALVMSYGVIDLSGHSEYGTKGSGRVYIFQDGGVRAGTWKKASRASQLQLISSSGSPIKLNAGQTWITLVASKDRVKYSGPPAKPKT